MIAWCAHPACMALIVVTVGAKAKAVKTCSAHAGQRPAEESDQERVARVCAALGWRRVVSPR